MLVTVKPSNHTVLLPTQLNWSYYNRYNKLLVKYIDHIIDNYLVYMPHWKSGRNNL